MSGPIRVVAGALFGILLLGVTRMVVARSWDVAVTVGKEIEFFAENGTLTGKTLVANASALVGIAYDDETYTLFLSDAGNQNHSIFSVHLTDKDVTAKPLLKREKKDSQVQSMVFDSQTRTLFWTTEKAIMKMKVPITGPPGPPTRLHKLDIESPMGIALDACNRHIYWANSNRSNPSIMRSNLDGSVRTVIVSQNLYKPLAIAVDHFSSKLYWVDDEEGIHYKVEMSNLDGSERTLLVQGKHHEPVFLAVDRQNVFWTESVYKAVWKISKYLKPANHPESMTTYDLNVEADPTGIITRDNTGKIDCKRLIKEEVKRTATAATPLVVAPVPTQQSFNNLTTSAESGDREFSCFNGGLAEKTSCRCKPGYSGTRCEISACHNYCLRGECLLDNKGMPVCKCADTYSGTRCENDVCKGFCLNDGRCSIGNKGKPSCECKYSSGSRCEVTYDIAEICALYCLNRQLQITSIDTSSCRCAELNQTIEDVLSYDTFNCTILVPLLSIFVGMLTIVVIFLTIYVSRLRRRPRIKKRFVVNKAGITPLTSRPSQISGDQCEITIENCCNMNICETPCFEPKLRTTNTKSGKKEEKNGLLDHMEDGGNSC